MTPREPDRFDAQARDILAADDWKFHERVAAALRAEHASALERAAQEIRTLDLDHIGALGGSREATRRVILDRLEHGETWQHPCACEKHRPAAVSARTPDPLREASEYCPLREPYIAAKARIAELESALIPPAAAPAAEVKVNACQVDLRTDKDRECFDDIVQAATRVLRASPIEININDSVWVKVTPVGEQVYRQHWIALKMDPPPLRRDAGGWTKFQLWELANVFGHAMYNGGNVPVETTIRIAAPAAETGKAPDEALRLLALVARKWTEAMTEIDASPLVVSIKEVARAAPPEREGK